MTPTARILIADARESLLREVSQLQGHGDIEEAFAAWILATSTDSLNLRGAADAAVRQPRGSRSYRDVATLGYAVAAGLNDEHVLASLRSGLQWLAGRTPTINDQPAGFCSDGIALLGIGLGARAINDSAIVASLGTWMRSFIAAGCAGKAVEVWQQPLFSSAALALDIADSLAVQDDPLAAEARVALRARGALPDTDSAHEQEDKLTTLLIIRDATNTVERVRAAVRLAALKWVLRTEPLIDLDHPSLSGVANLLRRLPAGLRRWTWENKPKTAGKGALPRQWDIENEYHVQNILWMLLAPIFPDLIDEVNMEVFGQLHPRADLCIPSLKLIVEVKFVRAAKAFARIIGEVGEDSAVYLSKPDMYQHIIAFIWDDSRRTHEHDLATMGLRKIPGVFDAVIVARPGSFSVGEAAPLG